MDFSMSMSPIKIGTMEVKNRFVVPAMGTNFANPDSSVSQQLIDYHVTRAKGGYGLIIVEVTAIDPLGKAIPFEPGIWDDSFIPGWKKLADEVHKYGCKIAVQLHHAGRQTTSGTLGGNQPVAPSPIPCPVDKEMPRELTTEEVYELIEKFGNGARRARDAGIDAVEVHGAHGYLVAQFMSAYSNKRMDEFGGNLSARMKFPVEIVKNIRRKTGNGYPIIFRMSGDERVPGGRTIDESRAVARIMEEAGVNAVHVSTGVYGSIAWIIPPAAVPTGFNLYAAEEIKKSVSVPVIGVGRINDPLLAEDALRTGKADMIALGRASLADPEFPNKVASGELESISPCIGCIQGCIGYIFDPNHGKTSCLVNPFVGKEGEMKIEKTNKPKKVMVVGGGPGGMEAAWIAAKRGHRVTLYEKEKILGGQFRIGAISPTKQEVLKSLRYYLYEGEKYGVEFKTGVEVSPDLVKAEKPDVVILATGGVPLVPHIKGVDNHGIVRAIDVLEGKVTVGEKVLIVGGGMVGVETADFLGEHGHKVTVMDMLPGIGMDEEAAVKVFLFERLKNYGVASITNATVKEFLDGGVVYEKDGKEEKIQGFDTIMMALGVKSYNPLEKEIKGKVPEVYVIGDAVKPRKALEAIAEAASTAVKL
ncbi:NADH oxidase [uncultured spirochete]|uniref:NADH oxidase n=1 Tax=uncultured spirochete TaxID=156406 RepID=A0A3P3XQI2_9SPIR|nr:NADH oxidase [uncultured spirochete]